MPKKLGAERQLVLSLLELQRTNLLLNVSEFFFSYRKPFKPLGQSPFPLGHIAKHLSLLGLSHFFPCTCLLLDGCDL